MRGVEDHKGVLNNFEKEVTPRLKMEVEMEIANTPSLSPLET